MIAVDEQSEVRRLEAKAAEVKLARPVAKRATAAGREKRRREEQLQVIDDILKNVEEKLTGKDAKATLGDYIKLMQLQKELDEDEQPREIRVTWVDALVHITNDAVSEASSDAPVGSLLVEDGNEDAGEGGER